MQVRTKRRKKLARPRIPMAVPTQLNERWSLDFVHDQLTHGRRIRILNIVDDYSRTCVGQLVDTSISGLRVARCLDELANSRGLPASIVMDNGPELTSKAMFFCSQRAAVKLHFIQPGKPTQNAFVESFNARLRPQLPQPTLVQRSDRQRDASFTPGSITTTTKDHTAHSIIRHLLCSKSKPPDTMFYLLESGNPTGRRSSATSSFSTTAWAISSCMAKISFNSRS